MIASTLIRVKRPEVDTRGCVPGKLFYSAGQVGSPRSGQQPLFDFLLVVKQ